MNLPNTLTIFRILLIPIIVLVYYSSYSWSLYAAAAIFWVASITDWFDGYIARKYQMSTPMGAFLDPVADKLMVAVILVMLVENHSNVWILIPAIVIIAREIIISALRQWMAELGKRAQIKVHIVGKMKTFAQMLAIFLLLMTEPVVREPLVIIGYSLLYIALVLTVWSMIIYIRAALPHLTSL